MVRQELQCTECGSYVQFNMDFSIDGNHTIRCPLCGHEHYRVVRNGRITDIRWQSSMPTVYCTVYSTSTTSSATSLGGYAQWYMTGDTSTNWTV